MNRKILFPAGMAALLFAFACTKQTVNKATEPDPGTPDTVRVTVPTTPIDSATATDNNNMMLGNPTSALADVSSPNDYLIDQTYYIESYSRDKAIPNWVSWHLQNSDIGSSGRSDAFAAFKGLPSGWYQVGADDYAYSTNGYDRGHNCPSADRTSSDAANTTTFLMTNMIPQASTLNQGPWANLEDYIRNTLVGTDNEAFIVMGNFGTGGIGYGHTDTVSTINSGKITVPRYVWKMVVVISKNNNDLSRIDANAKVLCVEMPNFNSSYSTSSSASNGQSSWKNYLVSVSTLEADAKKNGVTLDLMKNLQPAVKSALKSKVFVP